MTQYPGPTPEDHPDRGPAGDPDRGYWERQAAPAPGTPYGQPPWGPAPPPKHGRSATALALGLIAVVGALFSCGLSLLLSPVAWVLGQAALRDMRAAPGRWSGEGDARAGMVLGIIGTVLLVLAVIALVALIAWLGVEIDTYQGGTGTSV